MKSRSLFLFLFLFLVTVTAQRPAQCDEQATPRHFYVGYDPSVSFWRGQDTWIAGVTDNDQPLYAIKPEWEVFRDGGHVGLFLGENWFPLLPQPNARVEFSGFYESAQVEEQRDLGVNRFLLRGISLPDPAANSIDLSGGGLGESYTSMSVEHLGREYAVAYKTDHPLGSSRVTTRIGFRYNQSKNTFMASNQLTPARVAFVTLTENTYASYYAVDLGVGVEVPLAEDWELFGDVSCLPTWVTSKMVALQSIPAYGVYEQLGEQRKDRSVDWRSRFGIQKKLGIFSLRVAGTFEYWGFVPEIINPRYQTDPLVHLEQDEAYAWGAELSAAAQF